MKYSREEKFELLMCVLYAIATLALMFVFCFIFGG